MKYVEGSKAYGDKRPTGRTEAKGLFLKEATATTKPFIYLSAGVSNAEFTEALELAAESGVKFQRRACAGGRLGKKAFRSTPSWARTLSAICCSRRCKNINNVNERLKAATSWYSIYGVNRPWWRVGLKVTLNAANGQGRQFAGWPFFRRAIWVPP